MIIGDKIRLLRNEKKVSIRKLAELTGLSKSTLSDIENNVSKKPTIDTVGKIAKALQVPVSELFDGAEPGSNEADNQQENVALDLQSSDAASRFLRSVARAKDRPKETQDKIAAFIELILDQEDNNN